MIQKRYLASSDSSMDDKDKVPSHNGLYKALVQIPLWTIRTQIKTSRHVR